MPFWKGNEEQKHLGSCAKPVYFSPNLPQAVATCYVICLEHRRALIVSLLTIETGTNFTNFFVHLNM